MRWSWKLGRFAGIDVYIHATFLLLIGFLGVSYWARGRDLPTILEGIGFILAIFGLVVLHEYGHALTARFYSIPTRDITLYPIGGVARLERMPDDPRQEFWVALAGPAVNVVLALAIGGWLFLTGVSLPGVGLGIMNGTFLERLMMANVSLVVFNMIPAFPMDGGRVLRALMATRMDYVQATKVAVALGQGIALVFGFAGLFTTPSLIFIAFFVWIAAGQELGAVQMRIALSGIPVSQAMITNFQTLHPLEPVSRAMDYILAGVQQDFPVVAQDRFVGLLTRDDVFAALQQNQADLPVGHVMQRDFEPVEAHELLETVFARMSESAQRSAPVVQRGRLVGLLTLDNIRKFLLLQNMLRGTPRRI